MKSRNFSKRLAGTSHEDVPRERRSVSGAPYTPIAIGGDGKVYTENFGTMFVVGRGDDQ